MAKTYTYVKLQISKLAFDEIKKKLTEAGYEHCFSDDGCIDMHGLSLESDEKLKQKLLPSCDVLLAVIEKTKKKRYQLKKKKQQREK